MPRIFVNENFTNEILCFANIWQLLPADCQPQLVKYLLKSIGSDAANEIFLYAASEFNLNYSEPSMTAEQRTKIIGDCSKLSKVNPFELFFRRITLYRLKKCKFSLERNNFNSKLFVKR